MNKPSAVSTLADNLARYLRRSWFIAAPNRFGKTPILRARFNDAVFISPSRKYLFTANEKVANSTMRGTLQALEGGGALPRFYDPFKRWTGPLRQPSDIDDVASLIDDPDIYKFCVTRHPFARLVSCYRNKMEPGARGRGFPKMMRQLGLDAGREDITFSAFVEAIARQRQEDMNAHWRPQFYNVFMDQMTYDEVIPYEQFAGRMEALAARFYPEAAGQALASANRQATNSDELVDQYFDASSKNLARKIYAIDFEKFGYADELG